MFLEQMLLFTGVSNDVTYLYHRYANEEVLDSLYAFYYYGSSVVGYEYDNSIALSLKKVSNYAINSRVDTFSNMNIKFVSDTNLIDKSYALISSPIIFKDKIMIAFGWSEKKIRKRKWWIFYFQKDENDVTLISIYDFQKDDFYFKGSL